MPKDALDAPRWFEVDFAAAYHFADAYEHRDEVVVQRGMAYRCRRGEVADDGRDAWRTWCRERSAPNSSACGSTSRATPRAGRGTAVSSFEFPTFDARTPGDEPALLFAPTSVGPVTAPYFNAIASIDTRADRTRVHRYGADVMAEEHRFVPRPGSSMPGDGWLVGTLLDFKRGRSGVAVLDAKRVDQGPLAIAWVPYTVPLGFHGWFAG